ncbi:hypothetical protein [Nocardia huaxiensis]|uniref:Uncharacterized protein n=1 Tax=Nocardia huaxiensis TaxID=2755382 RepID=A0A7D6Z5S0_9NOCA|nr:hypothetical protein [Nocardia huaxiensis]QLY33726.1 hypothetical protein H0264_17135 [Nocardia huaxiensis]UFS99351.1 hypothetical protein LPY97_16385 [Nocardia huaxiensis]
MVEGSIPPELARLCTQAEAVEDVRGFGELLAAAADLADVSRGDAVRELGGTSSVYQWFRGETLPGKRKTAHLLAAYLARALEDRFPHADTEIGELILAAWDTARAGTRRRQADRGRALTRDPATRITPEAAPPRRGLRRAALVVALVILGAAVGFAVTRAMVVVTRGPVPPCAEAVAAHHSGGFVQLNIGYGPPGDPMASQRVELRVQKIDDRSDWADADWIAYAHLVQQVSDRDEVWMDWRGDEDGDGTVETYRCPAELVNQRWQTPGIRARDAYGERRWFRACAAVPEELAVAGRSRNNCTGWERPDD